MFVSTASFLFMIVALLVKDVKLQQERDVQVSLILDGSDNSPVVESPKIKIAEHSVRSVVEEAKINITKSKYWTDQSKYEFSHADFSYAKTINPSVAAKTVRIKDLDKEATVHVEKNNVNYKLAVHMKEK